MFRGELAIQSDMHLEAINSDGPELRWCIFTKGKKAPIAKIIVDTRPKKVQSADYEPTAHIVNVHVRPEYRGKKLGEHLVRLAQAAMHANGFVWMTLEAEENVEFHGKLVGLYERCGFEIYPPSEHFPLEYNGDECFRKVPMRCRLVEIEGNACPARSSMSSEATSSTTATTTTTTTSAVDIPSVEIPRSRFTAPLFLQEMKREAVNLILTTPLNVHVQMAVEWVDAHVAPGSFEVALRTGTLIRARGHPDWMELAGYLRYVGRTQEKWTNWHAPFMVHLEEGERGFAEPERQSDEEEDEPYQSSRSIAKSGPLPSELCTMSSISGFIDPDRYAQEGVDETMMTWSPNEFAFLALTVGDRCTAPREMAQVIRYSHCVPWLETDEFNYLEAYGDSDLKRLVAEFRDALKYSDASEMLDDVELNDAKERFSELVEKYACDVRIL